MFRMLELRFSIGGLRARGIARWLFVVLGVLVLSGFQGDAGLEGRVERETSQRIVELTNAVRRRHSLAPLSVNAQLRRAAEDYATVLVQRDWFDHIGPDGSTVDGRVEAMGFQGWSYLAENLAKGAGPGDPADVVAGWMNSAGHRDNILSPKLREIGVGCYVRSNPALTFRCVQSFGARGRPSQEDLPAFGRRIVAE